MTTHQFEDTHWEGLRRRVELRVGQLPGGIDGQEIYSTKRLIRKMMVQQAELKVQNETLLKNLYTIESVKEKYHRLYRKYVQLFDFAPNGYLIMDGKCVIREMNLTAVSMLNGVRKDLIGRRFTDFIHHDDQASFNIQTQRCRQNWDAGVFELKMVATDGGYFDALLQIKDISAKAPGDPEFSLSMEDINNRMKVSTSLALVDYCLEVSCRAKSKQQLMDDYVQLIKSYRACDAVGIRIRDALGNIPYHACDGFGRQFHDVQSGMSLRSDQGLCVAVINGNVDPQRPFFTSSGSFFVNGSRVSLSTVPSGERCATCRACHTQGYESMALIPIQLDETIHGLIHVADRRVNRLPLRVVECLENVGSRLGMALERFSLQDHLRESLQALDDLSSHLLTVQEDEQRRIAMELHDGCGQDLNVMKLRLKSIQNRLPVELVQECDQLLTYSDKIINDIRNVVHGMQPAALDALGLTAASRQMFREFSTHANIEVESKIELLDQIKDPTTQICLFRIFQEALTNVHKHARATWILVAANRQGKTITIRIEDNGIGFDDKTETDQANCHTGMGLSAIALRCRMIGAALSIENKAGEGVRLTICLPCPKPNAIR